jgi:hypothetical protein
MSIDEDMKRAYENVQNGYLDLVVKTYSTIIEEISERAKKHMVGEKINSLNLSPKKLRFDIDGYFYEDGGRISTNEIPKIYADYSDNMASQADDRTHIRPDVHTAMRSAVNDFRECVKKSLTSVL